ncbi:unnamed protein product [Fusarium graminearum]|uniref:Uncharacterized protein n=1 Tax=Gibberella zeae TaxID=5518 RepID=A0A9N8RMU8_GIBZA|nr:unnamed protein product [Fusarium graminearum]
MFHSSLKSVPTLFGRAHNHFQFQSPAIGDGKFSHAFAIKVEKDEEARRLEEAKKKDDEPIPDEVVDRQSVLGSNSTLM